ncbi:hypothetical protein, partial [Bradyrhizobium ottawaense]|uniref:hypothetical protein n=1 Tax=Bradyrhizobium ottawaense TaxID=931866 RepID=UPI0030C6D363
MTRSVRVARGLGITNADESALVPLSRQTRENGVKATAAKSVLSRSNGGPATPDCKNPAGRGVMTLAITKCDTIEERK